MYTVVDTQATTFLHQRQQHQVVMKDRKMAESEPRRPGTKGQPFSPCREVTSKLYWNVALASQGSPPGKCLPMEKGGEK